jgi:hypothetical protein
LASPRLKLTVTTIVMDQEHILVLDIPRGHWPLDELHELGRTLAEAAGILGEFTTAVSLALEFPEPPSEETRREETSGSVE